MCIRDEMYWNAMYCKAGTVVEEAKLCIFAL